MANALEIVPDSHYSTITESQSVSVGKSIQLSVVIPMYNQEKNAKLSLARLREVLDATLLKYEVVIVDDGSFDGTLRILRSEAEKDPRIKVISYILNRGKGHAVRTGVVQSHGDCVLFTDGDLDISPSVIKSYVEELKSYDLVIASKRHPLSKVNSPFIRRVQSRLFNLLVRIIVGIRLKDTQAGLKVGNGNVLRTIFRVMLVKRYAFDVELLTIASLLNLKIKELPIEINIDRRFRTREIIKMFIDVLAIGYRHRIRHWYRTMIESLSGKN